MKKFDTLAAVVATMQKEKTEFAGADNLAPAIEAACTDLGVSQLKAEHVNALVEDANSPLQGRLSIPQLRGAAIAKGYYQAKTAEEKSKEHGTSQVRKASIVSAIETILSMPKGSLESLGKGKKSELEALSAALISASDSKAANK